MRRRPRHNPHVVTWLWAIALACLAGPARRAFASVLPSTPAGRVVLNPRTGRPVVTRGSNAMSDTALHALIASLGFGDQAKAFAIAKRESAGVADVTVDTRGMSPTELQAYWVKPGQYLEEYSVGLFQINVLAHAALVPGGTVEEKANALKDASTNAHVALVISNGGTDWRAWGG